MSQTNLQALIKPSGIHEPLLKNIKRENNLNDFSVLFPSTLPLYDVLKTEGHF